MVDRKLDERFVNWRHRRCNHPLTGYGRTKQESETSLQRHREEPQKLAQPERTTCADGSKLANREVGRRQAGHGEDSGVKSCSQISKNYISFIISSLERSVSGGFDGLNATLRADRRFERLRKMRGRFHFEEHDDKKGWVK